MSKYNVLFSPISIGKLQLPNRTILPAMDTNLPNGDGTVSERFIRYHEERAQGGVGLIIVEATYIAPNSKLWVNQLGIDRDDVIPGLKELTRRIHEKGCKIGIQLEHSGIQANSGFTGLPVIAASALPTPFGEISRQMTKEEIAQTIQQYADAAERAVKAGFDLIELHGAHSYLLEQFLSPMFNHRTDEYGGSEANRERFPLEVVDAIRKRIGDDVPVSYRIYSEEHRQDYITVHYIAEFCKKLAGHGINLINVSGTASNISTMSEPLGLYVDKASIIHRELNGVIPVAVANRIKTPEFAEYVLSSNQADLVTTGRAVLCDPEFYNKARDGKEDEIRYCLSCNYCINQMIAGNPISCLHNPLLGREGLKDTFKNADVSKNVMIIGGGPAGMTAAYIAAARGHKVSLYEKSGELGGKAVLAARPPHRNDIYNAVLYLKAMLKKYQVKTCLNQEVTLDLIRQAAPEAIIMACGSEPFIIPGLINDENRGYTMTVDDILCGEKRAGDNVMVIGGGFAGMETAEALLMKGKKVSVIEMKKELVSDELPAARAELLGRVIPKMTRVTTGEKVEKIEDHTVWTDKNRYDHIDTVVLAMGYRPLAGLQKQLTEAGIQYQAVGDASKVRNIHFAVKEGFDAACGL